MRLYDPGRPQNPQSILADLASMLLSNVTASASACSVLLSLKVSVLPDPKSPMKVFPVDSRSGTCPAPVPYPPGDPKEVDALPLLLDAFVKAARVTDDKDPSKHQFKGDLHFLASVFANLSTVRGHFLFGGLPIDLIDLIVILSRSLLDACSS